jgi:hypothetical protein
LGRAAAAPIKARRREAGFADVGGFEEDGGTPPPGRLFAALVNREAAYFESHRDHLDYQAGADAGEPIGLGAMESACRQYQCRFKRPGQFWSAAGDEALLALETLWRNGGWHLLFPHAGPLDPSQN